MKKYQYIVCGILLAVQSVQSQDFGFEDDVQDVQEASIDEYFIPAIVLMVLYLLFFVYKRVRQIKYK